MCSPAESSSPSSTSGSDPGSSSTSLSKSAEPKEAEIVKDEKSAYRPAMWCALYNPPAMQQIFKYQFR